MSRAKKRALIIGVALLLLVFLLVLALPLWLPFVLGPVLRHYGVDFAEYERSGYGRFALTDIEWTSETAGARAARIETFLPTVWLWRKFWNDTETAFVLVEDWHVEIAETPEERPDDQVKEATSIPKIVSRMEDVIPTVIDWLPLAQFGEGEVRMPGDRIVEVLGAEWHKGEIAVNLREPELDQQVFVEADVSGGLPYTMAAASDPLPLRVDLVVDRDESEVVVKGEAGWFGNRTAFHADFSDDRLVPGAASFASDEFRLTAADLGWQGYQDVVGSFAVNWDGRQYSGRLQAEAAPRDDGGPLPPVTARAAAYGDLDGWVIEALDVRSPWLTATLTEPVALNYENESRSAESAFSVAADLGAQTWVEAAGKVSGQMHLRKDAGQSVPTARLTVTGEALTVWGIDVSRADLKARFEWPVLDLEAIEVTSPDGSQLAGSGKIDFESRTVAGGAVTASIHPELAEAWLPEELTFGALEFQGSVAGPFANLGHTGTVEVVGLRLPGMSILDLNTDWSGQMLTFERIEAAVSSGRHAVRAEGALTIDVDRRRAALTLDRFARLAGGETILEADGASILAAEWTADGLKGLSVDRLHWQGPEREISLAANVEWPRTGDVGLSWRGIDRSLIDGFVDPAIGDEEFRLLSGQLSAKWKEGPLVFQLEADARTELARAGEVEIAIAAGGTEAGIAIKRLRVVSGGELVGAAEGNVPLVLYPAGKRLVAVREEAPVSLRVETSPHARFWQEIGERTGLYLSEPDLDIAISGTPANPEGSLLFRVPLVRLDERENDREAMPEVTELTVDIRAGEGELRLHDFSFQIEGQRVEAEAVVPMGLVQWRRVVQERTMPDLTAAAGRLRIPGAQVAAFSRFAPEVMSPEGEIHADIELLPGGQLSGTIAVNGAATRPIVPFGSVRDGTMRLVLRGRSVELAEISGVVGGERLTVTGRVDLPIEQEFAYDLRVHGKNLPLTRRPGVVIRGDLDLAVEKRGEEAPLISGAIELHDSFYFAHLRLMPSGAVATPERRPPFFSIEAKPFDEWRLQVRLRGQEFLEIRGPIFQGRISSEFELTGTLREPVATGVATIEQGRVRFPFASLSIDQGEVALRRENPFQPQLFIVGGGMAFSYDLRMEITGTAEEPVIEFFSNPPLTSEQVLLMVTTGELPRDEIRFTSQQRASRFAIYFGQNLLYEITGDDSASDRLVVRSGEQVSESGRQTMIIEFRLTEDWSAVGEYDRFDEYNIGLKWNIYSR